MSGSYNPYADDARMVAQWMAGYDSHPGANNNNQSAEPFGLSALTQAATMSQQSAATNNDLASNASYLNIMNALSANSQQ